MPPHVKAVILVGGPSRGTRFRPLSLDIPKPLFPLAGKPLLQHHLDYLATVEGLSTVYLVGFFDQQVFSAFLAQVRAEYPFQVVYLREYTSLGTAGGLFHFRDEILAGRTDLFFVLNADVSFPMSALSEMLAWHAQHPGLATVLGKRVGKDWVRNFGCLVVDPQSQEVVLHIEKPRNDSMVLSEVVSCGVYLLDAEKIFEEIAQIKRSKDEKKWQPWEDEEEEGEFALVKRSDMAQPLRLEQDVLKCLAGNRKLFVWETKDVWRPLKTAGAAVPVNAIYLAHLRNSHPEQLLSPGPQGPEVIGDVWVHPSAQIHPSAKLGPNVSIGADSVIGKGCRVKEAVILDNVQLGMFSCVFHAVVSQQVTIGEWVRVEGTLPPQYDAMLETEGSVKLLHSCAILGKHVSIANEVMIRNCLVLPHKELKQSYKFEIIM